MEILNRSYLSRKFKEETKETLTNFILKEKTEEAKRLLRYSDKSLTAISSYLGFSSASHSVSFSLQGPETYRYAHAPFFGSAHCQAIAFSEYQLQPLVHIAHTDMPASRDC